MRLLVLGQTRMTTFPLPAAARVTIGRHETCDIRVDEAGVAPIHATLSTEARMEITDYGAGASTVVGNRRLGPGETTALSPGVVLLLGGVTMVVQASGASTRLRHVRSHDYFEGRLEDECARAESQRSTFSLVRLRFGRHQAQAVEEAFSRHLRPVDLVAVYAADEYELLLIDTGPEKVESLCQGLREQIASGGHGEVSTGVACWPRDGRSPEALLTAAGAALHGNVELPPSRVPSSGAIEALRPLVERVAATNISVLILGETGVGKEVLARRIHELSPRAAAPMLCMNCAALTETLLESELFGHERGAFTGAVQAKPGLLEIAEGGSVLLDEIGEMPLAIQAKLLRVVEERRMTRVGGLKEIRVDVRFMAATHRDLESLIAQAQFRQDLFYRLNGVSLFVPPLRERVNEIRPLAEQFIDQFAQQARRSPVPRLTGAAIGVLNAYAWPGNVRELRNVMERAVMLSQSPIIDVVDLPLERLGKTLSHERVSELPPVPPEPVTPAGRPGTYSYAPGRNGRRDELVSGVPPAANEDPERARIVAALDQCAGNQTHAAELLGISRRTLISRIERYGLKRPRRRER
ncbi:MAG TPA: sigma 54-interacting transcriptional regulator [Polyangiaceae bacterium]|nr:sigma 54-interacting transcriptional regulator [Polyangiaceae bacterium]